MIEIREATDADAGAIRDIIVASYADAYAYEAFYDEQRLKRLIFSENTEMLVAEDTAGGKVIGTASVALESGAYTDLVGEFGRLAVLPEARGRGVGGRLLEARIERMRGRLHVGFMEARVAHPYSVRNGLSHGFAAVGFLPLKHRFGERRESIAYLVRYFEGALELRRNHPRIIPEAYRLASMALANVALPNDLVVDDSEPPYAGESDYDVQRMNADGYTSLLRIERGRLRRREIFGPLRLHYGFFKLQSSDSHYLIARREGEIVGAIGYTHEEYGCNIRVFEMIALHDRVVRFLLETLLDHRDDHGCAAWIEIDVSAYSSRMQRTLYELGFLPVAYVPALAFHRVERLDLVKMAKCLADYDREPLELAQPVDDLAALVLRDFEKGEVLPRLRHTVAAIELFQGLSEEQVNRLAGSCSMATFEPGELLFEHGDAAEELYFLLAGRAEVEMPNAAAPVGEVGPGECLGEIAVLTATPHSAGARAVERVEAGVLPRATLEKLVRRRPDVGVVVYRNLARGLGGKLRRLDVRVG